MNYKIEEKRFLDNAILSNTKGLLNSDWFNPVDNNYEQIVGFALKLSLEQLKQRNKLYGFEKNIKSKNSTVIVSDSDDVIYKSFKHLSISFSEYEKLKTEFSEKDILDCFDRIENYKDNTRYRSLFLTSKQWLTKQKKETLEKSKQNGQIAGKQQYKFSSERAFKTITGEN